MSAAARAVRRKRKPMTINDASRFLRRSTLGVRYEQMSAVVGTRFADWVDAQLDLSVVPNQALTTVRTRRLPGFASGPVLDQFWPANYQYLNWKFYQPEILRTRLTYAVMELFSMGNIDVTVGNHAMIWDIIESEVTQGNFRSLIEKITRSIPMSRWLTYWRNAKTDGVRQPDENYGREIMQLYTIGLWELHLNGTRMKTGELSPSDPRYVLGGTEDVPTYGQSDVANMARVFTGLTARETFDNGASMNTADQSFLGIPNGDAGNLNYIDADGNRGWAARLVFAPSYHESTLPKQALYGRIDIPAGTNGDTSLSIALDALVDHPSCAPYLAGRFIRLLTSSNPSPEYVARVASVFRDDGTGATGNLRAFFRAILLDQEVMAPVEKRLSSRVPSFEEQRLALVLAHPPGFTTEGAIGAGGTGFDGPPGSQTLTAELIGMGFYSPLQIFQNPSVFGRWPAAYSAGGAIFNAGLKSPELATLTEGSVTDLIDTSNTLYQRIGNLAPAQDLADCHSVTGNRVALVDRLAFLITGGSAPQSLKDSILTALAARGAFFDTVPRRSETYYNIAAVLWLSPWGVSRN